MRNVKESVKGGKLFLEVDLSKENGFSKSGKTIMIGTSAGNKQVDGMDGIFFGLNVYKYPETK